MINQTDEVWRIIQVICNLSVLSEVEASKVMATMMKWDFHVTSFHRTVRLFPVFF